jgi:serine/threonine-protein kinase
MSREPGERYQTARALADDLEHWLADEPVSALPETTVQRMARWTRRHRAWALAATVALVIVAAVSTGAAVLIDHARRSEQKALQAAEQNAEAARQNAIAARDNEDLARAHAQSALEQAQIAKQNEELAVENAEAARRATEIANRNAQLIKDQYRKTVASVLELGGQLEKRLRNDAETAPVPELKALRSELFKMFGDNLLRLGKIVQEAGITDFAMASTYDQTGEALLRFGHGAEALQCFEDGRQLVEQAALERPDDDVARANLALLTMKIGRTALDVHDDARTALANFLKSCAHQREIMTNPRGDRYKPADNRRLLSMYEIQAGVAELRLGRPRAAQSHFAAALELRNAWLDEASGDVAAYSYVSECHLWLGIVAWHLQDPPSVAENFTKCLRICHELAKKYPNDASFLGDLAEVYGAQGDAQLRLGMLEEARASFAKSREFLDRLKERKPDDASSLALRALVYERGALAAAHDRDSAKARENYELARAIRDQLAELDPTNLSWLAARALTLAHCGKSAEALDQAALLVQRAPDSPTAQLQAARCLAVCSETATDPEQKRQFVERALTAVGVAARGDFADAALPETDPDLAPLQREPALQSLLKELKAK